LPQTEEVCFVNPENLPMVECFGLARWDQVRAVVGDLMKPVGIYPERYYVESFPTEEQLVALDLTFPDGPNGPLSDIIRGTWKPWLSN
jgi:hypothetical protein